MKSIVIVAALLCCAASTASAWQTEDAVNKFQGAILPPCRVGDACRADGREPTAMDKAHAEFKTARDAYMKKKVRTKAEYDYVMALQRKYLASYKRDNVPPPEYDHPYTGQLTIERVAVAGEQPVEMMQHCNMVTNGCTRRTRDGSRCTVYIVGGRVH